MEKVKNLYRGVFNYSRQVHALYSYAYSERQAWAIMCRRLACQHDVNYSTVLGLFDGTKDNFEIKIELEVIVC